ncbi:TolB family protein [Stratiformator vulcanicus]|uniref:Translocation protein TolB n=1 Tax=Stratiformator vulcanicus TaxID=2527980 RepID=A0A517R3L9_9PLAN|nr:hypothetical protein [Stratiformator vulcanicus]QDT38489.1 translocation protein TolB [Stratiformator vulcanicus]
MRINRKPTLISTQTCLLFTLMATAVILGGLPSKAIAGRGLFLISSDFKTIKRIDAVDEKFKVLGSPEFSFDGKTIVLDGWEAGQKLDDSRILIVNADNTGFKDIGDGCLPSLSPDGKTIAYSRYNNSRGVWLSDNKGKNKRQIATDGWSIKWLPDGKHVVYTTSDTPFGRFIIYNVDTEESTAVPLIGAVPFWMSYWNFDVSPDGKQVAFKGSGPNNLKPVMIANIIENTPSLKTLAQSGPMELCWHPDGKKILFVRKGRNDEHRQLYYYLLRNDDVLEKKWPGQDDSFSISACVISRDGKQFAVTAPEDTPEKSADEDGGTTDEDPAAGDASNDQ